MKPGSHRKEYAFCCRKCYRIIRAPGDLDEATRRIEENGWRILNRLGVVCDDCLGNAEQIPEEEERAE